MLVADALQVGGADSESWLGVPIIAGDRVIGVIALENVRPNVYTESDERLLSTLASSMGVALENARLFDETKRLLAETEQRNAELAVVNEIGAALAKQLDFDGIIEAVGARLSATLHTQTMYIGLYDRKTNLISFPYELDEGSRVHGAPIELGEGVASKVISLRGPLRFGSWADAKANGGFLGTYEEEGHDSPQESWLGVPIMAGDDAIGLVALGDNRADAFSDSDERLVTTVAASMGVALENARLFDETKRLLAETDERASELTIINEIGSALAKQLDFQGIVELVGDRVSQILDSPDVGIAIHEPDSDLITFPYAMEHGERLPQTPLPLGEGLTSRIIHGRSPLRIGSADEMEAMGVVWVGERSESYLGVPIPAGDRVLGVVSVASTDPNAFSEGDERLLSTLASSMGVALENARLFDETKRLLAETDERAAELAIITSVQDGLAQNLDMQSMYDLVGNKIQEIFDAQVVDIGILDSDAGRIRFPFTIERGVRFPDEPIEIIGIRKHVLETREPLLINEHSTERAIELGQPGAIQGEPAMSSLFAPLMVAGEARGVISLQNLDREHAFSESDVRLLMTLAGSLSVALENARLFDETKRLLAETDERAAELALINSVQEGLAQNLDMQAMYDLVGDRIQEIFDAQVRGHRHLRLRRGTDPLPVHDRARGAIPGPTPTPLADAPMTQILLDTRQPVLINDVPSWEAERGAPSPVRPGRTRPLGPHSPR